ncbi:processed acidic surface protein [Bacillus pinisoli]|uniref:processed acidic surface protein n=1 Tax=Bacillus pinisoli TaxID=2901866 RepID=UPI001FF632CA|nr:processed acidic surface protein [Bacillus pinisoli]
MKYLSCMLIFVFTFLSPLLIQADTLDELETYLNHIGWSQVDLEEYLNKQGLSTEQDYSPKELLEKLGTPVNESNIRLLLKQYKLSRQELDQLLHQVGENVEEYSFIEDLNEAVSYYIEHAEDIAGLSNFLSYIGLTEHETVGLYQHIQSLDPVLLKKSLLTINQRMAQNTSSEAMEPTNKEELFPFFNEVLSVYNLTATYHINASTSEGASQEQLNGERVRVELFNQAGNRIGDLQFSSDMLSPDFITQTSQQLLRIGETKHAIQLIPSDIQTQPNASHSPYVSLVYGAILLLGSTVFYLISRNKETRS